MVRGSYAEYALVPAAQLVKIPDGVDFTSAAAAMLQGMTAHYLTHSTYPLKGGETVLVHAAAGGAGRLIVQMARMRGARVFGTVSTEEKARIARDAGVDEVIRYTEQDFEDEARRLTDGRGVDVVYDSVGKTTFDKSLSSLRPRGLLALFGQSSGSVPPVDPSVLVGKGSLYLTRPSLAHYIATRDELLWRAGDVLSRRAVRNADLANRQDLSARGRGGSPPQSREPQDGRQAAARRRGSRQIIGTRRLRTCRGNPHGSRSIVNSSPEGATVMSLSAVAPAASRRARVFATSSVRKAR